MYDEMSRTHSPAQGASRAAAASSVSFVAADDTVAAVGRSVRDSWRLQSGERLDEELDLPDPATLGVTRLPTRGADASQELLLVAASRRRHRRLEDIVDKSLVHLEALETCIPENPLYAPGMGGGTLTLGNGDGSSDAIGDVAQAPALLAQAALALDLAMAAAVRHRGLVCAEEAEVLSALWAAAGNAMAPVVLRRVDAYAIARVDLELLRDSEAQRRRAALHDVEHMVVTATALDVRCLRLGVGVSRRGAALGEGARARCQAVLGWVAALLMRARRLLADVATADPDVGTIVGRTASLRLDGSASWMAVRDMGRPAGDRDTSPAASADAASSAEELQKQQQRRLSLIPEDEEGAQGGKPHERHRRRRHSNAASPEPDPLDAIDAALGDDLDARVAEAGDDAEDTALRLQRRARGAVAKAVMLALGDADDTGNPHADSFPLEDPALAESGRLLRLHSQRFAERSARTAAIAVQVRSPAARGTVFTFESARDVTRGPLGSTSVRSGSSWRLQTARSTTDLYQEVVRDLGAGGGGGKGAHAAADAAADTALQLRTQSAAAADASKALQAEAEAAASADHSKRLEPKRSAMRNTTAGDRDILTSRRAAGGVIFASGGAVDIDADIALHPSRRCIPPSYSATFETPQAREARELVESIAGMKRARVLRRRFRAAGLNARREVSLVSLGALSDAAAATASPAALLALVASLRAASGELVRETERLQTELGRDHKDGQAGASVTLAVHLARLEARRILIERHLGLPSGSRRTRHSSIDHAPLAFDRPSPRAPPPETPHATSSPEQQQVAAPPPSTPKPTPRAPPAVELVGEGEATDAVDHGATGIDELGAADASAPLPPPPPPPFPISAALGRRASLPVCRELAGAEADAAFVAELATLASRRLPTRQPPKTPESVGPLLVSARADSPLLYSPPEDDLNLHGGISPMHAPGTPVRSTDLGFHEAEASSPVPPPPELKKPGTPGIRPPPTPKPQSPPPGTAGDGGGVLRPMTGVSGVRTPRLTEDGEVTEWGNVHGGDHMTGRPPPLSIKDATPPGGKTGKSPLAANGRAPTTREGGRVARVARTRASLAALLQVGPRAAASQGRDSLDCLRAPLRHAPPPVACRVNSCQQRRLSRLPRLRRTLSSGRYSRCVLLDWIGGSSRFRA